MINFFKEWVYNLAAVSIILILTDILLPSGKSKKFINLIKGFILILTIVQPFFNLFFSDIDLNEIFTRSNKYVDAIDEEYGEIRNDTNNDLNAAELKKKQSTQIMNVYRKRVIDKIQKSILEVDEFKEVNADVIINEDYNSQNYGEIKKIYVYVYLPEKINKSEEEKNPIDVKIKKIEEVRINETRISKTRIDEKRVSDTENKDLEFIGRIERKINQVFGLEKENIVVKIRR